MPDNTNNSENKKNDGNPHISLNQGKNQINNINNSDSGNKNRSGAGKDSGSKGGKESGEKGQGIKDNANQAENVGKNLKDAAKDNGNGGLKNKALNFGKNMPKNVGKAAANQAKNKAGGAVDNAKDQLRAGEYSDIDRVKDGIKDTAKAAAQKGGKKAFNKATGKGAKEAGKAAGKAAAKAATKNPYVLMAIGLFIAFLIFVMIVVNLFAVIFHSFGFTSASDMWSQHKEKQLIELEDGLKDIYQNTKDPELDGVINQMLTNTKSAITESYNSEKETNTSEEYLGYEVFVSDDDFWESGIYAESFAKLIVTKKAPFKKEMIKEGNPDNKAQVTEFLLANLNQKDESEYFQWKDKGKQVVEKKEGETTRQYYSWIGPDDYKLKYLDKTKTYYVDELGGLGLGKSAKQWRALFNSANKLWKLNSETAKKDISYVKKYYYIDVGNISATPQSSNGTGTISTDGLAGSEVILPAGMGGTCTYMGWHKITSPSSNQYKLRQDYENFDEEGFGKIQDRYVIACTSTYGSIGDMIDFYFEDGSVIHTVMGDEKSQQYTSYDHNPANKWGHLEGKCVLEFVVARSWYGGHANPGTSSCHPEFGQHVVKAVNYGSVYGSTSATSVAQTATSNADINADELTTSGLEFKPILSEDLLNLAIELLQDISDGKFGAGLKTGAKGALAIARDFFLSNYNISDYVIDSEYGSAQATGALGTVTYYCQGDYAHVPFNGKSIKTSGCGITSFAMLTTIYGQKLTPEDVGNFANSNGGSYNTVTNHRAINNLAEHYGLAAPEETGGGARNCCAKKAYDSEYIKKKLEEGCPMIVSQNGGHWNPSGGGHYTLIYGIGSKGPIVYDPGNRVKAKASIDGGGSSWDLFNYVKHIWIFPPVTPSTSSAGGSGTGSEVVAYASQFIGNPYVWGGTDLNNGIDCSGFVMKVYEHFGYDLPHQSGSMQSVGKEVSQSDMQPGDIVCYSGHVAIYAGNGQIVHAANARDGIKKSNAFYQKIITVRRLL